MAKRKTRRACLRAPACHAKIKVEEQEAGKEREHGAGRGGTCMSVVLTTQEDCFSLEVGERGREGREGGRRI